MTKPTTVDEYNASFSEPVQMVLEEIRHTIRQAVPDATEVISYGIPTLRVKGKNMLHYGAYENHIGLYATPDGHAEFEAELSQYRRGKGSVQFPLNKPMPLELIQRIAVFRARQLTSSE